MGWLDFIKTIRRNDDDEKKRAGSWWGNTLNFVDNGIDAVQGGAKKVGDFTNKQFLTPGAGGDSDYDAFDVARDIPSSFVDATKKLGKFGADVAQGIPRGVVNLGLGVKEQSRNSSLDAANGRIDDILKLSEAERNRLADEADKPGNADGRAWLLKKTRDTLGSLDDKTLKQRQQSNKDTKKTHETYKASNAFMKFLIGGEPDEVAKSPQASQADAQQFLEGHGVSSGVAAPLSVVGAGVGAVLDAPTGVSSVFKGLGKNAIKQLAEEGGEDAVKKILKSNLPKVSDDIISKLAPQLAKATDEKTIKSILATGGKDIVNPITAPITAVKGKVNQVGITAENLVKKGGKLVDKITGKEVAKTADDVVPPLEPVVNPILQRPKSLIDKGVDAAKGVLDSPTKKPTGYGEATDELLGRVKYANDIPKPGNNLKEQLKEQFYDKLSPVHDLVRTVENSTGRKLATEDNPYELMRLYQGMPDRVQARVSDLADVLKQAPDINSVKAIGMARQIIDRGKDTVDEAGKIRKGITSTITPERAKQVIEEQRQKLGDVAFDKAASVVDHVNDYNKQLLDELKTEGIISEDSYRAIIDSGLHYFSKFNVIDHLLKSDANRALFASGGSYNTTKQTLGKILKQATGHEQGSELLDPIESIVRSTDATMRAIAKNRIWKSFDRLANQVPDLVQRVRDPENVIKRMSLASDNKELRPVRNGLARLIKTRGRTLRRLQSAVDKLEKKGLNLSLKFGGQRMDDAKFAVDGLGGKIPTSQVGKTTTDFVGTAEGIVKDPAKEITKLGRQRDELYRKAAEAMPDDAPGSTALRTTDDFKTAMDYRRRAKEVQKKIDAVIKGPAKAVDSNTTPSLLGPGDTKAFLRHLIENGKRSDIDRLKKMVGNRDTKLNAVLDDLGSIKSEYDDVASKVRNNSDEARALADKSVPDGYALISGFGKGEQGKLAVPQEIADIFTGKNKAQQDYMTSVMSKVNGFVKQNFTSNNPAFALVTNPIRDAKSFAYNAKDVKANPFSIGSALVGGLAERLKKGDLYKRWIEAGGKSGFYADERTGEQLAKDISRKVNGVEIHSAKDFVKEASRFITAPLRKARDTLHGAASILEDAPRVAQFKASAKAGKSDLESALNARNVTVDFQQSGRIGQTINAWVPFLNARLQGSIKSVEAIKRNPARAAAVYASLTAAPIALAALNNNRFPEVMKMIPDQDRDNNFVVVLDDHQDEKGKYDHVIKIPKSDVDKVLGNPLENFMRFLQHDDPDTLQEVVTNMIGQALPFDTVKDDKFNASRTVGSILPPLIKAPIENATNHNLYYDSPVVPDSLKDLPAGEQRRSDDPNTKKVEPSTSKVDDFLAPLIGGGSPLKAENTRRNLTGSLISNPVDQLGGKLSGSNPTKMNTEFYKVLNATTKNKNSASNHINQAIAAGDYAEAQKTAQAYNAYLVKAFTPFGQTYGANMTQELSDLYDQQKIVLTSRSIKQRQRNQLERQAAQ